MNEKYLVLDEGSNIVWTGLDAPTDAVLSVLGALLPGAAFTTHAVHHVLAVTFPLQPYTV
jgi:hypothetical protein